MPAEAVDRLRRWHEAAYEELKRRGEVRISYLGLDLVVPPQVFAPTPMSDLLGTAVLDEVRETDRVLDMGTGYGSNAILAASNSRDVTGVDISPEAIAAASANSIRNGVADRTTFRESDVFSSVEGRFDQILFDPPFRWYRSRDLLEASIADEDYRALTRFMTEVAGHLNPGGRILLSFGTSGDMDYLTSLIAGEGFDCELVVQRELTQEDLTVTYSTHRLTFRRVE